MKPFFAVVLCCVEIIVAVYNSKPADDKPPVVKFPEVVSPDPPPPPTPEPKPVTELPADTLYVIRSDVKVLVLDSPLGIVQVLETTGPVTIGGKFVDGTGKFEFREFKEKYVYVITPQAKGQVELMTSVTLDRATVVRKKLSVMGPELPRPPPIDPDPPVPDPGKKASKIIVVICESTGSRTVNQAAVINDKSMRDFVKSTGGSVELVSTKDAVYTANRFKEYAEDVGLPAVLVFDANVVTPSKPLDYYTLPDSGPVFVERLKKVVKK